MTVKFRFTLYRNGNAVVSWIVQNVFFYGETIDTAVIFPPGFLNTRGDLSPKITCDEETCYASAPTTTHPELYPTNYCEDIEKVVEG